MDRRFGGRFLRDATLTGPEARGSSPVRIVRDPQTRQSPAVAGLYPCGEGAGYAGRNRQRGRRWRADGAGDRGDVMQIRSHELLRSGIELAATNVRPIPRRQCPFIVLRIIQIPERLQRGVDGPHLALVDDPRLDGVDQEDRSQAILR